MMLENCLVNNLPFYFYDTQTNFLKYNRTHLHLSVKSFGIELALANVLYQFLTPFYVHT